MPVNNTEQIIEFENLGFPIQTVFHKILSPDDISLTKPKYHKELEIKLFLNGTAIAEADNGSYICRKGDIFLVNPGQPHSIRAVEMHTEYHLLMVDPTFLLGRGDMQDFRFLKPFLEGRTVFRNLIHNDEELCHSAELLFHELQAKDYAFELAVKGYFYAMISALLRRHIKSVMSQEERAAQEKYGLLLMPAISYISAHLSEDLPLELLAGLCNITPKYFCRVFRSLTGMTSTAYITELRIARAEVLILSTGKPIAAIAESVGIQDPSYFSRCFKKLRGFAPSNLR